MTKEDIKTITDIIRKTIYGSFDVCGDDEETPMTNKDKLLLEVNKAICTNLKALEQELCEDAISRAAVCETYSELYDEFEDNRNIQRILHRVYDQILSLPLVTPQPKAGEWIEHFDESGKWCECDQCHTDWGGAVNFCPNCGAKMI